MKVIGNWAFYLCRSLTNIKIPNSVTTIGDSTFDGCESLTSITIPSSVVTIIGNSFYGWHGILNNESKAFIYEDHALFNKNKTTLIAYRGKETNYTIPNSVTTIERGAFSHCESLTNINIPNSVTTIENSAFAFCESLTNINIQNSVTIIGNNGKRIRDASIYTSKKISLKLLFLSDIFLFPFVRQQFPVLA